MFTSSTEREIRHFHVIVVQRRQRNVQSSPSSLLIIRTLRSEDGDGSENVAEKVNSRSSNLQVHLREITVFMALADINFLLLLSTADDVCGLY